MFRIVERQESVHLKCQDALKRGEREKKDAQVLHDLREEETLRVVDETRVRLRHVVDARERVVDLEELVHALRGGERALLVLLVASHAPRVEVALKHLWAQDVVRTAVEDVEAVLGVEREVGWCGVRAAGEVPVGRDPRKGLRADASPVLRSKKLVYA